MIKADKWLVLKDGTCMNIDTGAILWASKDKRSGQKNFKLVDDKGKTHFYLQRDLLKERRDLERVETAIAAEMDYREYGDKVITETILGNPQLVDDFGDSIEVSYEEANKKLKYAASTNKSNKVIVKHEDDRDRIKSIMDFIES